MSLLEAAGLVVLGFVVGGYGTVIGAGGGFILVPLLLFIYPHYQPEEVTSISLAVVFANATSGSAAYARQRRIDYRTGLLFAVASAPGVIAGALAVGYLPKRAFSTLFGLMLLGLAAVSLRGPSMTIRAPLRGPGVLMRTMTDLEGRQYRYAFRIWQGVVLSMAVGFISSLFGIGGGVVHVPAMIILLHIPVQYAVATSHFVLAFMSGGGSGVHVLQGTLGGEQLLKAAALGLGAIPGAQVGALLAHRIRGRTVLLLLSVAIVALGIRLLLSGLFDV
ncbi:MAG: sulfite exporter TauE/SafE family protein [Chloroflexi bacterium]|nr:MAG: sulfite exporter TauE/SafE family protein [Chloroflexota bacterium]